MTISTMRTMRQNVSNWGVGWKGELAESLFAKNVDTIGIAIGIDVVPPIEVI
jgi:hypothetical protein